jgi:hypothetical protein
MSTYAWIYIYTCKIIFEKLMHINHELGKCVHCKSGDCSGPWALCLSTHTSSVTKSVTSCNVEVILIHVFVYGITLVLNTL